jgi:hypothetical protein
MQCRFCLEIGTELISPCKCRGSIQYIHPECRKKWVVVNDEIQKDRLLCSLCKEPLYCNLETLCVIPKKYTLVSVMLFKPFQTALFMYYIIPQFKLYPSQSFNYSIYSSHAFIHCFYILLYLLHMRIKNPALYSELIIKRKSYLYVLFHALFLYYFFKDLNLLMGIASNITLGLYLQ